jgi:hypothetical protein
VRSVIVKTIILPRRVQAHCTAAFPNSLVDCVGDIGMASIASPAMMNCVITEGAMPQAVPPSLKTGIGDTSYRCMSGTMHDLPLLCIPLRVPASQRRGLSRRQTSRSDHERA